MQTTQIGIVSDLFAITGHGLVVITSTPLNELPNPIRIGDTVEFRTGPNIHLRTLVCGIERASPWDPSDRFAFLAEPGITKDQIPLNSEIWHLA